MTSRNPSAPFDDIDLASAYSMLLHIPSDDRSTWIDVGMALKSEFGDAAFSSFDSWSESASNYSVKSTRDAWRSFKGQGISIATLVHVAKQHGWKPDREAPKKSLPKPQKPPRQTSSTSSYAKRLFLSCNRDDQYVAAHPYAINKGIVSAFGAGRGNASGRIIGKNTDCIIVPIRNVDSGKVQGVQCINAEGKKQTFGKVGGGALILGNTLDLKISWYVVEGWASAVSVIYHHGKQVCACSFGKANQDAVGEVLDSIYQPDNVVILVEVD